MPQITLGRAEASATANFCASALQSGGRAPLTIVTTPNIPPVVAPQRKANHFCTSYYEACIATAFIAFPTDGAKYVKKQSPHPKQPTLTHLHNDGPGRVVQEEMQCRRSATRGDQLPLQLCSVGGACKKYQKWYTIDALGAIFWPLLTILNTSNNFTMP